MAVRICGALQTAHEAGVLHRDLKPHNVFVSAYGEPALGDFGISTIDDERSQSRSSGLSIAYAAPEVLEDGDASVASDVYSTGITLYQLVSGTTPFAGPDLASTVRRILTAPPPRIDRAGLAGRAEPRAPGRARQVAGRPPGVDARVRRAVARGAASCRTGADADPASCRRPFRWCGHVRAAARVDGIRSGLVGRTGRRPAPSTPRGRRW